ncbi:hypothetical protein I7X12_11230 [Halosimplex litoreum]|uniref:Uncharacterized protein n=1 Tax=Halosimplex litoreum TaxID=1198301 RepID=A0A7T3FVM0_9EURY|nr:hypothetical protein [Halosimplex litoreum]QPV61342.1 hypothetical protein I7X12_11230 [Halosimplex litoreum]
MDPESLRALGGRFWYAWAAAMVASAATVVAGTAVVAPPDAWLVATSELLALVFVGFGVVSAPQGERLDAAGMAVAGVGTALVAVSAATGYPGGVVWTGFGLGALGSAIGIRADHGDRVRAAVGG